MTIEESSSLDLGRAKSVGEIIFDALRCYAAFPALFAVLTLAVVLPYGVIVRLVERDNLIGPSRHGALAWLVLNLVDVLLVGPLISALHVHALVEISDHRVPRVREVFPRGLSVLPTVAAAQIIAGSITGVGFALLIVPGLALLATWAVVAQVAAIERTDATSASARAAGGGRDPWSAARPARHRRYRGSRPGDARLHRPQRVRDPRG